MPYSLPSNKIATLPPEAVELQLTNTLEGDGKSSRSIQRVDSQVAHIW